MKKYNEKNQEKHLSNRYKSPKGFFAWATFLNHFQPPAETDMRAEFEIVYLRNWEILDVQFPIQNSRNTV